MHNPNAAAINQCTRHAEHPVSFLSLLRFGLLTRMVKLLILCAVLVKLSIGELRLSDAPCYKPKPFNYRTGLRIVGGSEATKSGAPYMVGLMKHGAVVCGGSIISENFLILAAHCVCNNQNQLIKPSLLKAFIGMHKRTEADNEIGDGGASEVVVDKIIAHPEYVCGKKAENDIGEISFEPRTTLL